MGAESDAGELQASGCKESCDGGAENYLRQRAGTEPGSRGRQKLRITAP